MARVSTFSVGRTATLARNGGSNVDTENGALLMQCMVVGQSTGRLVLQRLLPGCHRPTVNHAIRAKPQASLCIPVHHTQSDHVRFV